MNSQNFNDRERPTIFLLLGDIFAIFRFFLNVNVQYIFYWILERILKINSFFKT